jgi:hypothetical protein
MSMEIEARLAACLIERRLDDLMDGIRTHFVLPHAVDGILLNSVESD